MMKRKRKNQFQTDKFCKSVRKRYRKRFKKSISATNGEIMKCLGDILEWVMDEVVKGKKVVLNKYSYIQVIGVPILEHKSYMNLAKQGLAVGKNGVRKSAGLPRRKDFIYGIEYVNTISKEKIYFNPHPAFSGRVHKALEETNVYYHIVTKNSNKNNSDKIITKN